MNKEMYQNNIKSGGWSIFLDRDGVINKRKFASYVMRPEEFELLPGVMDALVEFSKYAEKIIVVTNQRGIARQLMTEQDLADIHAKFLSDVEAAGARIDGIYHCPHDNTDECHCRKPNIGMAEQAQKDHPSIQFFKSIMFGDTITDMQMGRLAGMSCIQIGNDRIPEALVNVRLDSLADFWK